MIDKVFVVLFTVLAIANAVTFLVIRDMDYLIIALLFLVIQKLQANDVVR